MQKKKKITLALFMVMVMLIFLVPNLSNASATNLQAEMELREEYGLKTDLNHVKAVVENPHPESRIFGLSLSYEEFGELSLRKDIINNARSLQKYSIGNFKDVFAGLYFDHKEGVLKIGLTDLNARQVEKKALENLFNYPSERLVFFDTKYTYDFLRKKQEEIDSHGLVNLSINLTHVSIPENKVIIGIADLNNTSHIEQLYSMFGEEHVRIIEVEDFVDEDRSARTRPLEGGLKIYFQKVDPSDGVEKWYYCTGGFSATDYNGNYFYVTNGHCADSNSAPEDFYQGSASTSSYYLIGTSDKHVYGSYSDSARIPISSSNASNKLYGGYQFTERQLATDDVVGEYVEKSGATTGLSGGFLKHKDVSITKNGVEFKNQRLANYPSDKGDSGSPVYEITNSTNKYVILKGLHHATTTYEGTTYKAYSHVGWVLYDMNLSEPVLK